MSAIWNRSEEAQWWGSEEEYLFHDELDRQSYLEWLAAGRFATIGVVEVTWIDDADASDQVGARSFPCLELPSLSREE
jgi:hypothetical protein